jgi:hypothetical protein
LLSTTTVREVAIRRVLIAIFFSVLLVVLLTASAVLSLFHQIDRNEALQEQPGAFTNVTLTPLR